MKDLILSLLNVTMRSNGSLMLDKISNIFVTLLNLCEDNGTLEQLYAYMKQILDSSPEFVELTPNCKHLFLKCLFALKNGKV